MTSKLVMRGAGSLVLVCGVIALAGCGPSDSDEATDQFGTEKSVAADVPAGYDPCTDVPQSILDSEKLKMPLPQKSAVAGGIKWEGCMWTQADGYTATIQTTNVTVTMVLEKNLSDTRELEIAGRRTVVSRQVPDHPEAACTLNTEMAGGSLEINLSNPPTQKDTGHLDTCELTVELAKKIVPTLPAGT